MSIMKESTELTSEAATLSEEMKNDGTRATDIIE